MGEEPITRLDTMGSMRLGCSRTSIRLEGVAAVTAVKVTTTSLMCRGDCPCRPRLTGQWAAEGNYRRDHMPYGSVREVEFDCWSCDDTELVNAECLTCDGSGEIIISADGDKGVCGECGGDGYVKIPCPKCSNDHAAADAAEQERATAEGRADV